jgi:hypothetical protein
MDDWRFTTFLDIATLSLMSATEIWLIREGAGRVDFFQQY